MASIATYIVDNSNPNYTDEYYAINGVKHGEFKRTIDGNVSMVQNYVDGELHGTCIGYYVNGKPYTVYNYNDGLRHGMSTTYTNTGKIIMEEHFVSGDLHGECKCYNPETGTVTFFGLFVNGLAEGEHFEYDERYKTKKVYTYVNGKKNGPFSIYMYGKLNIQHHYENDKLVIQK
jgi:antitoxin component YwqK of YwqJK toxin-antitoxin module